MDGETDPETELGFIPNMKDNGLYCFLNEARLCGPECMAFVTNPRESKGELSHQQTRCTVLSSIERVGRHLPVIVQLLTGADHKRKVAEADRKREEAVKEAAAVGSNPFGGRR